jgi:Cys-rich protein (TIGR01571 family)
MSEPVRPVPPIPGSSVPRINEYDNPAMSMAMYERNGARGGPVQSYDTFSIGLFAIGNIVDCLFSCCCPPCALAKARTQLDGSDCAYNFFCVGHVPERWMIRTGYGIPGDGCNDLAVACCCFPCSVNQLYQTTKSRGNPTVNGGHEYNKERFNRPNDDRGFWRRLCCGIFCLPCTSGAAMQRGVGMPFWMGCGCMNICTARNIIRYQHRILGNDCLDECILPSLLLLAAGASVLFPLLFLCIAPVIVARSMQVQAQSESRPTQSNRYLINDNIRQIPVQVHQVVVVQPSVVRAQIVSAYRPNERQPAAEHVYSNNLEVMTIDNDPPNGNWGNNQIARNVNIDSASTSAIASVSNNNNSNPSLAATGLSNSGATVLVATAISDRNNTGAGTSNYNSSVNPSLAAAGLSNTRMAYPVANVISGNSTSNNLVSTSSTSGRYR